jgi:hypothetical protein
MHEREEGTAVCDGKFVTRRNGPFATAYPWSLIFQSVCPIWSQTTKRDTNPRSVQSVVDLPSTTSYHGLTLVSSNRPDIGWVSYSR